MPIYVSMMVIDGLLHFYLLIIQILKSFKGSLGDSFSSQINVIEQFINQDGNISHLIAQVVILALYLFLAATFMILIYQTNSLKTLNNFQSLKKAMTLMYTSIMTFLQIPLMLIVLCVFFLDYKEEDRTLKIITYSFAAFNALLQLIVTFVLFKLFIIRIPSFSIPWSASNTQLHFMKILNKLLLVILHLYVSKFQETILIFQIAIFFTYLVTGYGRIFIIPHYSLVVDWCQRVIEISSAAFLFILLLVSQDIKLSVILGIIVFPAMYSSIVSLDNMRIQMLVKKLFSGKMRLEIEYEYTLFLLINMVGTVVSNEERNSFKFSTLLLLIDEHNKQYIVDLYEDEIDFLNSSGTDVFIQSDKNSAASKTLTNFQVFNFYQDYGDNKQALNDESENKQNVQINLKQLKLSFLNRFIEIYFEEAQRKFPASKRLFFQYAYFTLYSCGNVYMTETLLRNFDNLKMNWIERVSIKVNELHTIMEIRKFQNQYNDNDEMNVAKSQAAWGIQYKSDSKVMTSNKSFNTDSLDPEHYILMTLLTNKFYEQVEKLTGRIQSFWKNIQSDNIDVYNSYLDSTKVAMTVAKIYETFDEIENEGKRQDSRIYYVFALIQKFLLNDFIAHDLYLSKMNSFRDMKKLVRVNLSLAKIEDTGFLLAHGQEKNFGKIIICNQIFRRRIGISQKDLKHANIQNFMPQLVKTWHPSFVSDFNRTGINYIVGRNTCVFAVKANGFVAPAIMNIRFNYSKQYEFTFACFMTFLNDMQIQKNSSKHRVDNIMFFICDDIDGRVMDISEQCAKQLGLSVSMLRENDLETKFNHITIEDICPQLNLRKIKQLRKNADNHAAIEEIVELDLNVIKGLNSNKIHSTKKQQAMCQVFSEAYGSRKDKVVNIISMIILDQYEMRNYVHMKNKARKDRKKKEEEEKKRFEEEQKKLLNDNGSIAGSSISSTDNKHMNGSSSASGSSRSGTGSTETEILKQMYASTEKRTPKSLKLIAQMISLVFIIMIVVSTINLILTLSRSQNLVKEVQTLRKSYDRLAYHSKTSLLLRGLLNMANGYEPFQSEINDNRYQAYIKEMKNQINKLKEVSDWLEKVPFEYSDEFRELLDSKILKLEYVDENSTLKFENQTHQYGNNLYIQRMTEVTSWNISQFKGNLETQTLKLPPTGYNPTQEERTIYFIIQNGQNGLRYYDQVFSEYYQKETLEHAVSVISSIQVTIIVSIVSIVIVSLVVSPIICKIEERKYIGLKFFIYVDAQCLMQMLENCETFLMLAFSDSSVHTGTTHQENNIIKDKKLLKRLNAENQFYDSLNSGDPFNSGSSGSSSLVNSQGLLSSDSESDLKEYASMYSENKDDDNTNNLISQKTKMDVEDDGLQSFLVKNLPQKQNNKLITQENMIPKGTMRSKDLQNRTQTSSITSSKDKVKKQIGNQTGLKTKQNTINRTDDDDDDFSRTNSRHDQFEQSQQTLMFREEQEKETEEEKKMEIQILAQEVKDEKYKRIRGIIYRRKFQTVLTIGILSIVISSYFIACYFLAEKSFLQTPEIIESLNTVYYKDICLENAMSFVRENIIRNKSMKLYEDPNKDAATHFIKGCQENELKYTNLRRDLPSVFVDLKDYIQEVETEQLCHLIYSNDKRMFELCMKAYFGLLSNGLTYSTNVILTYFQNQQIQFQGSKRTLDYLTGAMKDDRTIRLTEIKDFILDNFFIDFKDRATSITQNYYSQLIDQYSTLYGIFIVCMVFLILFFFIYLYNGIRDTMWRTNLSLKIMPMDFIPREHLADLKAFFNT